jgi:hypothetical protein
MNMVIQSSLSRTWKQQFLNVMDILFLFQFLGFHLF